MAVRYSKVLLVVILAFAAMIPSCETEEPSSTYGEMFDEVNDHVWNNGYDNGDWDPDWDDAPFYGPAYYAITGFNEDREEYQERAREAVAQNLVVAQAGLDDILGDFRDNASAILYGTLGVIDYMASSGDLEPLETVDEVLSTSDDLLAFMNNYVSGFENYATETYGPTSITAIFALLFLQHAVLLQTDQSGAYVERARQILTRIDELVWNGNFYQFSPENETELFLYPNVAMIIALNRLYQATGEEEHLDRAEEVYQAIQALKCPDRPGYQSPYSAETMGAQTDDYTTLSSTNYLILALALLNQNTGQASYRSEIDELIGFIEDYLWVPGDGRIYHHWMDGRVAIPEDPEYYCIGCNLQFLYIRVWIHTNL